jgi:hypothetical protein
VSKRDSERASPSMLHDDRRVAVAEAINETCQFGADAFGPLVFSSMISRHPAPPARRQVAA